MSKTAALVNDVNQVYCMPTSGSELLTYLCVPFFSLLPTSRVLDITIGCESQELCPHKCEDNRMSTQAHTGKDDHFNQSRGHRDGACIGRT